MTVPLVAAVTARLMWALSAGALSAAMDQVMIVASIFFVGGDWGRLGSGLRESDPASALRVAARSPSSRRRFRRRDGRHPAADAPAAKERLWRAGRRVRSPAASRLRGTC